MRLISTTELMNSWILVSSVSLWTLVRITRRYRMETILGATGGRLGLRITPSSTTSTFAPG